MLAHKPGNVFQHPKGEARAGYRLLLHSTGGDVHEIDVLESLSQRYVDGLVLCPIRVTVGRSGVACGPTAARACASSRAAAITGESGEPPTHPPFGLADVGVLRAGGVV